MGAGEISLWKTPSAASPAVTTTATSSPSSSSSSSEISSPAKSCSSTSPSPLEEEILAGLKQPLLASQEAALMLLRTSTRDGGAAVRASLCSHNLLAAILPFLLSRRPSLQSSAGASLVNLSLHPPNRAHIVRAGAVPALVELLRVGRGETQGHAAAALFSLAVEDGNSAAIGALGALPPLLRLLAQTSPAAERLRRDAAMAVYHLSMVGTNQSKLVKLGAVKTLLGLVVAEEPTLSAAALMTLCNLGARGEGRAAMMDAGAVAALVGMLRVAELPEVKRELCVAALYLMSRGNMRFRALARDAAAEEVLLAVAEGAKGRSRRIIEMAKKAFSAAAATKREEEDAGERLCGSLPEPALRGRRRWRADQQDFRGLL
ncbi:unnamed protein product [Spirodela intermedia]|uniref:Uncharacterized protein n=1 Tax=Spirodela intermedia TaxID=51605 RepID=A0A7I8LKG4_SPIIN|nr:unnamed protein product [Spirodela intermedia]